MLRYRTGSPGSKPQATQNNRICKHSRLLRKWQERPPNNSYSKLKRRLGGGKLMRERTIWIYFPKFRESLEAQELAPLTIKSRMTGVCSFYKSNNIELPVLPKSLG